MNYEGIDITSYEGTGFKPLVFFEDWRIAILNHQQSQIRGQVPFVERHHETDETFILLSGSASLLSAGSGDTPSEIKELPMECGKIYNVLLNVWHAIITEADTKLLIVENSDTSEANTSYFNIDNLI